MAQGGGEAAAPLAAVGVKLPTFWTDNPEVWFLQAEAQFDLSNITSQRTKFHHVLVVLPKEVINSVTDVIRSAAEAFDPYDRLKGRLLAGYVQPRWARMSKLIHHPGLGDQRPSHLMDQMLALLSPATVPGEVFMGLYMDRLPVEMRAGLGTMDFEGPRDLAAAADLIWDARGLSASGLSSVAAVGTGRQSSRSPTPRAPGGRQGRRRPATPASSSGASSGLCYFHRRYAEQAHRCEPPCNWSGNPPSGPRSN
jgi:hypothetical protein